MTSRLLGRYKDISQAETWVTENLRGSNNFSFMVELNEDDDKTDPINSSDQPLPRIIGSIGTPAKPELEPHQKVVREIGYMYRPDQWGKGYATESTQALIKALFEKTDVTHVIARTDSENYGSWKVLEKCGFKRVDTADYDNVTLGKRTVLHYEIARPGYAIKGEQ